MVFTDAGIGSTSSTQVFCEMRQRALTGYSRLFCVIRVVSIPVEAVLRTRIDVDFDRVPTLDTCADSRDGIFRDVWIGFGEMEEKRAFQASASSRCSSIWTP